MKKNKLALILTVLVIVATAAAFVTAAAASGGRRTVQATLSPDITIKYNGEVQAMKDAGGNTVYPLTYGGTTYLPIRAVSDMLGLPVNWVQETKTVELGTTGPKSFLDVTDDGTKTTSGNTSRWVKVLNTDELPENGDSGSNAAPHSEAIKTDSCYMSQKTKTVYKLDRVYSALEFTVYNRANYSASVQILDSATGVVLWSAEIGAGGSLYVPVVDISRSRELEFSAALLGTPVSARHSYNAVYICDPAVR